jgi:hypothetical protein
MVADFVSSGLATERGLLVSMSAFKSWLQGYVRIIVWKCLSEKAFFDLMSTVIIFSSIIFSSTTDSWESVSSSTLHWTLRSCAEKLSDIFFGMTASLVSDGVLGRSEVLS